MIDDERLRRVSERIKTLMDHLGMDQVEFAEYIGLPNGQSQVSRWLRGESAPGSKNAALIAEKGNGDPSYYQGLELVREPSRAPSRSVPVVGEVQAGVWRESIEFNPEDQYDFPLAAWMGIPNYDAQAFIVRGTSMNRLYPDGSVVVVANIFTNPIAPRHGDIVLVRRKNQDGLFEASLKELAVESDGSKWLWPRSFDPRFQGPLSLNGGNDDGTDTLIVGVVVFDMVLRSRALTSPDAAVDEDDRTRLIVERHNRGDKHTDIAEDFGITRERVRQIVASAGGVPRKQQRIERRARRSKLS